MCLESGNVKYSTAVVGTPWTFTWSAFASTQREQIDDGPEILEEIKDIPQECIASAVQRRNRSLK